jgi:hypothetical protein
MKFEFNLSVGEVVVNYVVMMFLIIAAGFTSQWWLALFALPLFLRGLTGWCPVKTMLKNTRKQESKKVVLENNTRRMAA